jgi:DNA-binding LytR/AlgR family response regulator
MNTNQLKAPAVNDNYLVENSVPVLPDALSDMKGNEAEKAARSPKTSFLVMKHHKYIIIATESIAHFYVKYGTSIIVCFDKQEYFVSHSLEQIQNLVSSKQFFRLNRQYLINFRAVKEVEHYFARKLLVHAAVPVADKLLVPKEKASAFLNWLDHR